MTAISSRSRALAVSLITYVGDLLENLEGVSSPEDARNIVARYVGILDQGLSINNAETALRGANLLTTTNKGISDLEIGNAGIVLSDMALTVTRKAIETSRSLQSDLGMDF